MTAEHTGMPEAIPPVVTMSDDFRMTEDFRQQCEDAIRAHCPMGLTLSGVLDAVESVRDDERDRLRAEVARLRAGEDPTPIPEGAEPTAGQWIARWNAATAERRLDVAAAGRANATGARKCFLLDHEGRIAHAEERAEQAEDTISRVRAWANKHVVNADEKAGMGLYIALTVLRLLDGPADPGKQTGSGNG